MKPVLLSVAAAAAILLSVGATAPAQARMLDPALSQQGTSLVETVQYRRGWRHRRHCWRGWRGRMHCSWR